MQVIMFTANHPFIFCTQQRALIRLPSLEDRQLFDGRDTCCLDHIHGAFESAQWVCLIGIPVMVHVLFLFLCFLLFMPGPAVANASFCRLAAVFLMRSLRV